MEQTNNVSNLEDIRVPADAFLLGEFDGKKRYIRFDLNAFAEMERMYGGMEAANEALSKGSMAEIRKILWLGLIWDEAVLDEVTGEPIRYNLTVYQVGRWLTAQNMRSVMQDLTKAINGSLPEQEATQSSIIALNADATEATGNDPNR